MCLTVCGLAIALTATHAQAATFTVANTNDSGAGSLRQAILNANAAIGADVIDATGVNGTVNLASALPDLSDITLRGSGSTTFVVSGSNAVRPFNIPSATVVMSGLGITGGVADNGGAIQNGSGRLTLLNVRVIGNSANGAAATNGGGAVYNNGGLVVIRGSILSGNSATGTSGSGGAIFANGGSLQLQDSALSNNRSNRAGGAIETRGGASVNIAGGAMTANSTGSAPGNGGALHMSGADSVSISATTFTSNSASSEGGALWNSGAGT